MYAMTAAHPTLPIPSYVRVRNPANGREVVVRINDRGPFHAGRIIDLSYTAALKLDLLRGVAPVELERITPEEIRTGAWQRGEKVALKAQREAAAAAAVASAGPASPPTASPPAAPALAVVAAAPPADAEAVAVPVPVPVPVAPQTAIPLSNPAAPPDAPSAATPAQAPPSAAAAGVPARAPDTPSASGYWVQIGAFRERSGAEAFQRRVASEFDWLAPLLAIFDDPSLHRLQVGPYPNRGEASSALQRIGEALRLKPVLVERR